MGRLFWPEDEQFGNTNPGCISGIFHALQHQYRQANAKKTLPQRKHDVLIKHAKRNRRPERISNDQDSFEALKLLDAEANHTLVDQSTPKTCSTQKRSLKARIKGFVSEEIFRNYHKERGTSFPRHPRLQRTYSIHHLESDEWVHPIIFFPKNVDTDELTEKVIDAPVTPKEPNKNVLNPEIKDYVDVLEIFKVNKELFGNVLQDGFQKAKLTKSGSFPAAYKSGSKNLRPTKLKHKLNESYSASKSEKRSDTRVPKLASSNSGSLVIELDKQAEKNSEDDLSNRDFMHIRRISSLDESASRYAQLFDYSASREAILRPSRSLKLTNESGNPSSTQAPIFFRRIHSLPHGDTQEYRDRHLHRSASQDERNPVALPSSIEKHQGLDSTESTECLNGMTDGSYKCSKDEAVSLTDEVVTESTGIGGELYGSTVEEANHLKVPETSTSQSSLVLVPECCSQEKKIQSEFQISEGFELLNTSEENSENEIKSTNKQSTDLKTSVNDNDNDDDDFSYVREILERSGFIKNGFQQTWYSSDHPLDPLVFQEIESQDLHDPECFEEEIIELSHHLLLFDLVDEILLNIYERSYTYYPKALSSSCHIRLAFIGENVLEEVWKRVSRFLNLKPDMSQSLDSIVSQDLARDDGWMNLQFDSECLALELEDLILDELLEELF